MYISIPLDYVCGHLRYGHLEGNVKLSKEEEKEFLTLYNKLIIDDEEITAEEEERFFEVFDEKIIDQTELVIDDYEIDDYGHRLWEEAYINPVYHNLEGEEKDG